MNYKNEVVIILVEGITDRKFMHSFTKFCGVNSKIYVFHTDPLTSYDFDVNITNCKQFMIKEFKKVLTDLKRKHYLKPSDIRYLYYLTDTDNCFDDLGDARRRKRALLNILFSYSYLHIGNKDYNFGILFYSHNLEHCFLGKYKHEFGSKLECKQALDSLSQNMNVVTRLITSNEITTFKSIQLSYDEIKYINTRATNINLLKQDEI